MFNKQTSKTFLVPHLLMDRKYDKNCICVNLLSRGKIIAPSKSMKNLFLLIVSSVEKIYTSFKHFDSSFAIAVGLYANGNFEYYYNICKATKIFT